MTKEIGTRWDGKSCVRPDPFRRSQVVEQAPETQKSGRGDEVNHPKHYTEQIPGVECIQVVEHMTFNLGAAVKYIWRCNDKGNKLKDLQKARWYIDREIKRCFPEEK